MNKPVYRNGDDRRDSGTSNQWKAVQKDRFDLGFGYKIDYDDQLQTAYSVMNFVK